MSLMNSKNISNHTVNDFQVYDDSDKRISEQMSKETNDHRKKNTILTFQLYSRFDFLKEYKHLGCLIFTVFH